MQVVPRRELPGLLRASGLDPSSREYSEPPPLLRLTFRESVPPEFTRGPHRKRLTPDGHIEGPYPLCDRPALSRFVATAFLQLPVPSVLALLPEGALWLNNRAQSAHLARVPEARHVGDFLRRRGLTDRFSGGFKVYRNRFTDTLPLLAANTFVGGADVLFVALDSPQYQLTLLSCHHFDLHLSTRHSHAATLLADIAPSNGLRADGLTVPELPEAAGIWSA